MYSMTSIEGIVKVRKVRNGEGITLLVQNTMAFAGFLPCHSSGFIVDETMFSNIAITLRQDLILVKHNLRQNSSAC